MSMVQKRLNPYGLLLCEITTEGCSHKHTHTHAHTQSNPGLEKLPGDTTASLAAKTFTSSVHCTVVPSFHCISHLFQVFFASSDLHACIFVVPSHTANTEGLIGT